MSVDHNDKLVEVNAPNKECIDCGKLYSDCKSDKAKRKCRICKCNEHGCLMGVNHATSKGDLWLCSECMQLTNIVERKHPDLFENLRTALMRKNTKRKKNSNQNKTSVNKVGDRSNKKTLSYDKNGDLQMKDKLNSRNPLSYLDIVFNDEDMQSLNEGEWISDSIIAFWFKYLEDVEFKDNQDILFIPPSVTQALKGFTEDIKMILEPLNICQKKYILLAVNDNKLDRVGGQHWSLLVYSTKKNVWYHYDSLDNFNLREAQSLIERLQEAILPGSTPNITTACCMQQDNNYDCGAYTMINAQKMAWIFAGEPNPIMEFAPFTVFKESIKRLRNKVRGMIKTAAIDPKPSKKNKDDRVPRDFNGFKEPFENNQNPPLPPLVFDTNNQFRHANNKPVTKT